MLSQISSLTLHWDCILCNAWTRCCPRTSVTLWGWLPPFWLVQMDRRPNCATRHSWEAYEAQWGRKGGVPGSQDQCPWCLPTGWCHPWMVTPAQSDRKGRSSQGQRRQIRWLSDLRHAAPSVPVGLAWGVQQKSSYSVQRDTVTEQVLFGWERGRGAKNILADTCMAETRLTGGWQCLWVEHLRAGARRCFKSSVGEATSTSLVCRQRTGPVQEKHGLVCGTLSKCLEALGSVVTVYK